MIANMKDGWIICQFIVRKIIDGILVYGLLTEEETIMKNIEKGLHIYVNKRLMRDY